MNLNERYILLIVVVAIVTGLIFILNSSDTIETNSTIGDDSIHVKNDSVEIVYEENVITKEDNQKRLAEKQKKFDAAREITTPNGFINTDGITVSEFIGKKVILIDFWTYSCINCQRTIPYLNSWYEKYEKEGLIILGVHTPEFEFEKDYNNVVKAVEKFEIKYPVILDNDYSTWTSYKNRYWPRKYLIDIDGFIVYDHIGEGAYNETEEKIVELLSEKDKLLNN